MDHPESSVKNSKEWFLYVVDHHEGPYTVDEIKKKVKDGDAKNSSFIWKEGYADWVMMTDVNDFGEGKMGTDSHGTPHFAMGEPGSGPDMSGVAPSASLWCLNSKKLFSGPHSMKTIIRKINDGDVSVSDTVWREGWNSFVTISHIPEFMQGVKPDVLDGTKKKKGSFGGAPSASASAIGLGGGPSVRSYAWYKSTKFFVCLIFLVLVGIYQATATGMLDYVYEKAGVKAKIKAIGLTPLPLDSTVESILTIKDKIMPYWMKVVPMIPQPVQGWLSPVAFPAGLKPSELTLLTEAAFSDPALGVRVAVALSPQSDEMYPVFVLASNAADSNSFTVLLKGKEGTLLNAFGYEKTQIVSVDKHLATTLKFSFEASKPLPKGEYVLSVGAVGFAKTLYTETYFLGGKKDAAYKQKLTEFNERVSSRLGQEAAELKQMALMLESMANDSATLFNQLSASPKSPQRIAKWRQFRTSYLKMSGQLKSIFDKVPAEIRKRDYVLPQLYEKFSATYELTEKLNQAQTLFIEQSGSQTTDSAKFEAVRAQAIAVAKNLKDLKESVFKVIK